MTSTPTKRPFEDAGLQTPSAKRVRFQEHSTMRGLLQAAKPTALHDKTNTTKPQGVSGHAEPIKAKSIQVSRTVVRGQAKGRIEHHTDSAAPKDRTLLSNIKSKIDPIRLLLIKQMGWEKCSVDEVDRKIRETLQEDQLTNSDFGSAHAAAHSNKKRKADVTGLHRETDKTEARLPKAVRPTKPSALTGVLLASSKPVSPPAKFDHVKPRLSKPEDHLQRIRAANEKAKAKAAEPQQHFYPPEVEGPPERVVKPKVTTITTLDAKKLPTTASAPKSTRRPRYDLGVKKAWDVKPEPKIITIYNDEEGIWTVLLTHPNSVYEILYRGRIRPDPSIGLDKLQRLRNPRKKSAKYEEILFQQAPTPHTRVAKPVKRDNCVAETKALTSKN